MAKLYLGQGDPTPAMYPDQQSIDVFKNGTSNIEKQSSVASNNIWFGTEEEYNHCPVGNLYAYTNTSVSCSDTIPFNDNTEKKTCFVTDDIIAFDSWVSKNGTTWTKYTLPISGTKIYAFGKYFIIGFNKVAYSEDFENWTTVTTTFNYGGSGFACLGNDTIVVISSSMAGYSTDGINWTKVNLPFSGTWKDLVFGNNTFVSLDYKSLKGIYSTDNGATWHESSLPSFTTSYGVYYDQVIFGKKFVAKGYATGVVITSDDGITWTKGSGLPSANKIYYANNEYLASVGSANSAGYVYYSSDGSSWYKGSEISPQAILCYHPTLKKWFACTGGGGWNNSRAKKAYYSSRGWATVWTSFSASSSTAVRTFLVPFKNYVLGPCYKPNAGTDKTYNYMYRISSTSTTRLVTDNPPTTSSLLYYPGGSRCYSTISEATSGSITIYSSKYYRDSTKDEPLTACVGTLYPDYICFINDCGIKVNNQYITQFD